MCSLITVGKATVPGVMQAGAASAYLRQEASRQLPVRTRHSEHEGARKWGGRGMCRGRGTHRRVVSAQRFLSDGQGIIEEVGSVFVLVLVPVGEPTGQRCHPGPWREGGTTQQGQAGGIGGLSLRQPCQSCQHPSSPAGTVSLLHPFTGSGLGLISHPRPQMTPRDTAETGWEGRAPSRPCPDTPHRIWDTHTTTHTQCENQQPSRSIRCLISSGSTTLRAGRRSSQEEHI